MSTWVEKIESDVIGSNQCITTALGVKPLVYADYTASGRALKSVERYISEQVLPYYANTHSSSSYTGAQTTLLREQAREIIKKAVNAKQEDRLIFCGSGATSAINKVIDLMDLKKDISHDDINLRPVVFIGPYEHHSNELPWRECHADVISIPLNEKGLIDTQVLIEQLIKYKSRCTKIGSFSAVSNVTGLISDVPTITNILKQHNAYSFWDYAAGAPYIPININGDSPIDAVFISAHKFVGGVSTCGILVAKKHVFKNSIPSIVGGGTVEFVSDSSHKYVSQLERKEEGGTPAIIESIRTGLVFKVQQQIGTDTVKTLEQNIVKQAMKRFSMMKNIEVLGSHTLDRVAIFSLRFKHKNKDLHYGLISAILNDFFGIQVRGGCSCAGPYGHKLLGIDDQTSNTLAALIAEGEMIMRPGWVRLNFNYFINAKEFNYIIEAISLVSQHAAKLQVYYYYDKEKGVWLFQNKAAIFASSLDTFSMADANEVVTTKIASPNFEQLLNDAKSLMLNHISSWQIYQLELSQRAQQSCWFYNDNNIRTLHNKNLKEAS